MATRTMQATAVDGRRARGERTRLRVLEALLELVEEGEFRPTAQAVALRAGVALRTVYHHFEDVEGLRRMALDLQMTRHREILQPADSGLSLDERITLVARQCRRLHEAVTPIRRATLFDENSTNEVAEGLTTTRAVRRAHLQHTFSEELRKNGADNRALLDAADVATAWQTWYYLRYALGRSAQASERVVELTLHQLFSQTLPPRARRR